MKKILVFLLSALIVNIAQAKQISYVEEMQALGAVSGQGLACNASKYDTFELLARAIMISKASSDAEQEKGMKAYNEYKADAFISKMRDGFADCRSIAAAFDKQAIFSYNAYCKTHLLYSLFLYFYYLFFHQYIFLLRSILLL